MYDFGNRLRYLREANGLSRKELAKKINISEATISRYENDKMRPTLETSFAIAKVFNVSLDWMAGRGKLEDIKWE